MQTIHEEFRALTRAEILTHLLQTPIGRVGFVVDGQVYVLPVNYVADGCANVVFRTARTGLLSQVAGRVAFEVDGYDALRRVGWSVHITGAANEITDATDPESVRLRRRNVTPWAAGPRGRWFAIVADEMTGRHVVGRFVDEWFAGVPSS